jgi:hypothetical protein
MITYLYWAGVLGISAVVFFGIAIKAKKWKPGIAVCALILVVAWGAYAFHFQQIFVKRYGGVMRIQTPEGMMHMGATWKDDNLWIENYDPATNTCIFSEYSKGNILEGRVIIKNCNPMMPRQE